MSDGFCILSRRPTETVVIFTEDGKEIEVTVMGVRGSQVRLGFKADESIKFVREELLDGE